MLKSLLVAALAVSGFAQAQNGKYDVSQRQFDRLLEIVQKLEQKNRRIGQDFGSPEVMPRDRDRRDFRREMSDMQGDASEQIARWIERVKSNDITAPIAPLLPAPPDLTLSEEFIESSGYNFYDASSFNNATARAQKLCEAWRTHVTANNAGMILFAQCAGSDQVKMLDGKIGSKVTGQMKLSFSALMGLVPPQTLSNVFAENTGYNFYDETSYQTAVKTVLGQCTKWTAQIKGLSKGLLLAMSCGAPKITKGFDGKLWVTATGLLSYTSRPSKTQPTVLTQSFVNSSGYNFYDATSVKTAGAQSETQCLAWANDTLKNSTALPLIVTCNGPEVVQNNKIDVRFTGKIVLIVP